MIRRTVLTMALGFPLLGSLFAQEPTAQKKDPPRVEIVFALDTTGSMGGLIDAAKKKVWSIASEIVRGKPTPLLRVGLVGYRDKRDAYVTKITPLTEDLDKVYEDLMKFQAGGGGDHPENVRQALHESLTKIEWTREDGVLRIVFLVGDAPPHLDYTDVPTLKEICESACRSAIIINTVRCGGNADTARVWQEIARKSEGTFVSIDQSGGVVAVATPYDKQLSELSDRLGKTVVAYGRAEDRKALREAEKKAKGYAAAPKAARASAKARSRRLSKDDLVDALKDKRVKLEELKQEELPEELKKLKPAERKAYVEKKSKEREEIRAKIVELSKKRDEFIKKELKKRGVRDAFDEVVLEALRKQAKKVGVTFEKE